MKPFIRKALTFVTLSSFTFLSITAAAQVSTQQSDAYDPAGRLQVQLKISPASPEFKAGIAATDTSSTRLRIWVSNGTQKKFTISVLNDNGTLWSADRKDSWYSQVYDLSSLDDGVYTIRISNDKSFFEKTFSIRSSTYFVRNLDIH